MCKIRITEKILLKSKAHFGGGGYVYHFACGDGKHECIHVSKLKLTTFYTLIMCSLLYTNYTLINLENNNNTVFKKRGLRSKLIREGTDNQTWLNRKARSKQVVESQERE